MAGDEVGEERRGQKMQVTEALVRSLYFILNVMGAIEYETESEIKT